MRNQGLALGAFTARINFNEHRLRGSMTVGGGMSLVPGTVARIFKDEVVMNPRLQIIFSKFLDRDQNNQPRWK
jgi:hypothetical protein